MGSRNKFGWLSIANVTSHQKATETSNEIPLRLVARAFAPLSHFAKVRLRASPCAQNDR